MVDDRVPDLLYKYRAFISYSHQDKIWGDWLHRALETYSIPQHLRGQGTAFGPVPQRLYPIFRDREELPTSADLPTVLHDALAASRHLIVICSPHAAQSRWVHEEILTFKGLGRADQIYPVIVGGTPLATEKGMDPAEECFPLALRRTVGADGALTDERTELIAADARAEGDGKELAKLKLIAGLIGVGLEELRRRDLEAQRARFRLFAGAAVGVSVVFAGLAGLALVKQRDAELERDRAFVSQSRFLAERSRAALAAGSAPYAARIAASALPDAARGRVRPLVGEAEASLAQALWSDRRLAAEGFGRGATDLGIRAGDDKLLFAGNGHAWAFSVKSAKVLWKRTGDGFDAVATDDDGTVVALATNEPAIICFDGNTGEPVAVMPQQERISSVSLNRGGSRLYATTRDGVVETWDVSTAQRLSRTKIEGDIRRVFETDRGKGIVVLRSGPANLIARSLADDHAEITLDRSAAVQAAREAFQAFGLKAEALADLEMELAGVAINPHSGRIYAAEGGRGRYAIVRRSPGEEEKTVLEVRATITPPLVVSKDGRVLLVGGADGKVMVFDLRDQKLMTELDAGAGDVAQISFAPDSSRAALVETVDGTFAASWSLYGNEKRIVQIRERRTGELPGAFGSRSRKMLAGDGYRAIVADTDGEAWKLIVHDLTHPGKPAAFNLPQIENADSIAAISVAPDGSLGAALFQSGRLFVIDLWTNQLRATLFVDEPDGNLGWRNDSSELWAASRVGRVEVWATGRSPVIARSDRFGGVESEPGNAQASGEGIAISGDGRTAALARSDGSISLWSMETLRPTKALRTEPWRICDAGPADRTGIVAVGPKRGDCRLLDVAKGALGISLGGEALGFSAGGEWLAVAAGGRLNIVDGRTGARVAGLGVLPSGLTENGMGFPALRFNPKRPEAAVVGFDSNGKARSLSIWRAGQPPKVLGAVAQATLTAYDWSDDGDALVAGFDDGRLLRARAIDGTMQTCELGQGRIKSVDALNDGVAVMSQTALSATMNWTDCPRPIKLESGVRVDWFALLSDGRSLSAYTNGSGSGQVLAYDISHARIVLKGAWQATTHEPLGTVADQLVFAANGVTVLRAARDGASFGSFKLGSLVANAAADPLPMRAESRQLLWLRGGELWRQPLDERRQAQMLITGATQTSVSARGDFIAVKTTDGAFHLLRSDGTTRGSWQSPAAGALDSAVAPLLSPNGNWLSTLQADGSLRLVDIERGSDVLVAAAKGIRDIAMNDRSLTALHPDGGLIVAPLTRPVAVKVLRAGARVRSYGVLAQKSTIVAGAEDGVAWLFNDSQGGVLGKVRLGSAAITAVAGDEPSQTWIAGDANGKLYWFDQDEIVRSVDATKAETDALLVLHPSRSERDGIVVASFADGMLGAWTLNSGMPLWSRRPDADKDPRTQMEQFLKRTLAASAGQERIVVLARLRHDALASLAKTLDAGVVNMMASYYGRSTELQVLEPRSGITLGRLGGLTDMAGMGVGSFRLHADSGTIIHLRTLDNVDREVEVLRLRPGLFTYGNDLMEQARRQFGDIELSPSERTALYLE